MGENKRIIGSEYERAAAVYLQKQGYEIIEHNFFSRYGEIDIIAKDGEYLVFIEVKYRKNDKYGMPQEAVSATKRRRIISSSRYYCIKNEIPQDYPVRYDVVAILGEDIEVIKNAFWL